MQYRGFFICLLLFSSLSAWSTEFESPKNLKLATEQFLTQALISEYAIADPQDIQVTASNLDSRLKLKACDNAIQKTITSPKPYRAHLSVKLKCSSPKPWSIYVPTQVKVYNNVVVLSQSLERGAIITENDIELKRMDTTVAGVGHLRRPSQAIGMQLKRRLHTGQPVRLANIKLAQVVKKGDKVVLEAIIRGLSVVTSGKALGSGQMGQQIQVRNVRSQRVVDAKIIAPGRVQVSL